MPKHYFKKYIPHPDKLRQNKALGILGSKIYEADLWHLTRRSVARAFLNGLFWAALPMPFQMVASALCAVPMRANIPLSIALVWLTNPITMPIVFYANYLLGTFLVGGPSDMEFKMSVEWMWHQMEHIWLPLYVGSIVAGLVVGGLSYFGILLLWRLHVVKRWQNRKLLRLGRILPDHNPKGDQD
ncbi:DUF2062 domain-containing protein [Maribrevibacterium harenarium]|uniref:DUF2062 domain-containing protein n=1 Tax=Maribrevibacterium harenarium TaxID=2589817 RepID=A0A501X4X1_9GAMM|nr:DUF2062 domain-containing protein [Maribrevibacterium harenarium]TPE55489.1 DUF2062 domain-containing protein [Maribrevibacterium harenarium]